MQTLLLFTLVGLTSVLSANAAEQPVLNKWFALGSACKGKDDFKEGSVVLIESKQAGQDVYQMRFKTQPIDLRTTQMRPTDKQRAKECAFRININPPPRKRIRALRAKLALEHEKQVGPELILLSDLKLGNISLDRKIIRMGPQESIGTRTEWLDQGNGALVDTMLPELACGEPKIIGLDVSLIVIRDVNQKNGEAFARLADGSEVQIAAELEDCSERLANHEQK